MNLKSSIITFFAVSMVLVATASYFVFSYWEKQRLAANTAEMVTEQIHLIVNEFEAHRIISYSDFISRNIYDLERVDSLQIFDSDCVLLTSRPLNIGKAWKCDPLSAPKGTILVELDGVNSDSKGSPKYILAGLNGDSLPLILLDYTVPLAVFLLLMMTILVILYLMVHNRIVDPLEKISNSIQTLDTLDGEVSIGAPLPAELQKILDKIIEKNESLKIARKQIQKYSQSEAKFVVGRKVAHDMKSPLAGLRNLFNFDEPRSGTEKIALLAFESIEGTISTLLKNKDIVKEDVPINSFIQSAITSKRIELGDLADGLDIVLDPLENETHVKIDPKVFFPVVSNILNNSIHAVSSKDDPKIGIKISEFGEHVRITFRDNGIGIEKEKLNSIFKEGFSYGKSNGYGYGLSSAADTVSKHGGSIAASSEHGEWTEINITL